MPLRDLFKRIRRVFVGESDRCGHRPLYEEIVLKAREAGLAGATVLRLGPLAIDTESYEVSVAGRVVDLTYKEFELLRFLVEHAGRVFTRSALLQLG